MNNRYKESNPELFVQLEQLIKEQPMHYGSCLKNTYKHVYEWCLKELDAVGCHPSKKKVVVYFILNGLTEYPSCAICGNQLTDKDLVNIKMGFHKTCSEECRAEYFSKYVTTEEWRRNLGESIHHSYENMSDERYEKWLSAIKSYYANESQEDKNARIDAYRDTVRNRSEEEKKKLSMTLSNAFHSMTPEKKAERSRNISLGLANMAPDAKEARNAKIGRKNSENFQAKTDEEKEKFRENQRIASANRTPETLQSMVEKCAETKRRNGSFNTSKSEEATYELLVREFGADDVVRQYKKDERYPFSVDFYIKTLDLFIECNYSWTHGGHWFDPNSSEDREKAASMYLKFEKTGKKYYKNAADTWTTRDLKKHQMAIQNSLNFIVFWDLKEALEYDFRKLKDQDKEIEK